MHIPVFYWTGPRTDSLVLSPPPNTQIWYLGPAFDPSVQALRTSAREKIFEQVTSEMCRELDKIAPNYISITTVPNFLDVRSFIWKNFTEHFRMTYAINLERSGDEILTSFNKNCRQKITRLSAHSPEIQQTNDVGPLLNLWRGRFSDRGVQVPLLSENYFKDLVTAFPQDITIYQLNIDGMLVAANMYCVLQKGRYCAWIGGVNTRKDLGANEYLD